MANLITTILGRLGFVKAGQVAKPSPWQASEAREASWDQPDLGVISNQADLYRVLSWVFAAVDAKANMASSSLLSVKRMTGEDTEDIPNHPFEALMRRPNPLQSRMALWYDTYAYRSLTGNAYWWLNCANEHAAPSEIWLIPSDRIRPVPDEHMYLRGYMYRPDGGAHEIPLELWEVVHFRRWNPRSRFIGMSEIESVAIASSGDIAAQKWNANYFGRDNAKIPGILAFNDPVSDPEWTRIQKEVSDNYTGTKRKLMMLRGVGKSVEFIANAISQKDMEFLGGREFTKEEIWTVLAPGLASVLAVNATEANANAGERTFRAMAVWPMLVAIAEQVTLDVLPRYGDNLVAEFDDIRVTDRNLELQERQAFERVHTVNEVRNKYDEADPLPDEVGALLVAVANTASAAPSAQPEVETEQEPGDEQQPTDSEQAQPEEQPADESEQLPEEVTRELGRWQRKAVKSLARSGKAQVQFESDVIPQAIKDAVTIELENALSEDDIKEAFTELGQNAVKASINRRTAAGLLDPNGEGKDAAEARLLRLFKMRLNGQMNDLLALLGDPPDFSLLTDEWWETQTGKMIAAFRPEVEKMMLGAVDTMIDAGVGVDWGLAAGRAAEYASTYSYELVKGITDQTRKVLQNAINDYVRTPGMTRADLEAQIAPWFSEARASRIAVTETTRAFAEGEKAAAAEAQALGLNLVPHWHTRRDELVCPICGRLDDKKGDELGGMTPPAHPNCRCFLTHEWVVEP